LISASSSSGVAGKFFVNQVGPQTLVAKGAKEGVNTSHFRRHYYKNGHT